MRTVFLSQWFDPEPGAIRGLPLARELAQLGMDVEVLTGVPNYPAGVVYPGYRMRLWQREMIDGIPITRVPLFPSHDTNPVRRVFNYASFAVSAAILGPLLIPRGDVGYVYHPPATIGLPAATMKAFHQTPFIYHIADMWPESVVESGMIGRQTLRRVASTALGRYCQLVYRLASAITVLSPGFKRLLVERGVPEEKIHLVYNWADDTLFHPRKANAALAVELELAGKFNIVYAGNLGPFQALETVIHAAARLRHISALQVVLIGTGVREDALKRLAFDVGATNVKFIGRREQDEMPEINSISDVLLVHLKDIPVFRTTIPSKTQVALASGRPVLMAVNGDAADLIRSAGAGIVIKPQDEEQMAHAMLQFYEMGRDRLEEMGERGHKWYLETMSLKVGATRMKHLLELVHSRVASTSEGTRKECQP